MGCCDPGTSFKTDPVSTTEGACCSDGLDFSFDPTSEKGQCCPLGQSFVGGLCQPPKNEVTKYGSGSCSCDRWPKDFVCACDGNLGIKYGHCYTMTDINGLQLNRDTGGTYQSGGDIGNLIFRVSLPRCFQLSAIPKTFPPALQQRS